MSQLRGTHLGRGWLEDRILHLAAGVPRSLVGRPVTVQGGSSRGASALLSLLCAFKRRSTLSGLLRRSKVKPGTTMSSWGVEPWETLWGRWQPR